MFKARDSKLFSAAFPNYWKNSEDVDYSKAPWDSPGIARWFASRMQKAGRPARDFRPGTAPNSFQRGISASVRNRYRQANSPRGWTIESSTLHTYTSWGDDITKWHTVWIGGSGEIVGDRPIGIAGLKQMGELLELSHPDIALGNLWPPKIPTFEEWFKTAVHR